jgi:glycosyltransferase involved in cell wall biosynthesis
MSDELPTYNFLKPQWLATWLARLLDRYVPLLADRVIAISDELGRFVRERGVSPEHLHVIPLGVDNAAFQDIPAGQCQALRARHGIDDRPLVMYTGILDRFQRLDYLLQGMRIVVDRLPEARLLLVANVATAQDLRECREMISALGLEQEVTIVLQQSFAEIPLFLAAADVTVVPRPHCPGFPVKLLNYMAAGKPIVVFEGSSKGLQHLHSALVVPDHDWQALGYGILTLLQDPALARTLGLNAHRFVHEQLAWPSLAEKIENVYYELLEPHATTTSPKPTAVAGTFRSSEGQ